MKKNMVKTGLLLAAGCAVVSVRAGELGVGFGASFGGKASFSSEQKVLPFVNNPGTDSAGTDHYYDDGFNRVDSTGNSDRGTGMTQTTYWGYQNAPQYDPVAGTITMNSDRTLIDAASSDKDQEGGFPTLEIFWQQDFTKGKSFNVGWRAAGRWQRLKYNQDVALSTTTETTADTYSFLNNTVVPPSAPFIGSPTGPNTTLGDTPTRSVSTSTGNSISGLREINGSIIGFDLGPTLSLALGERFELVGSAGATAAFLRSNFKYSAGDAYDGKTVDDDWLFGAYAGAELQCRIGEKWGILGGATFSCLEDFDQQVDGHTAELTFEEIYSFRLGFYTEL